MNRPGRILLGAAIALIAALAFVLADGIRPRDPDAVRALARLTGLPAPAVAVSYLEPRCRLVLDDAAPVQPGLAAPRTLDFVHGP